MSDWFSTAIAIQQEIIRAQQDFVKAQQAQLDAGKQFVELQKAGQKAADANVKAWKVWAGLWGIK